MTLDDSHPVRTTTQRFRYIHHTDCFYHDHKCGGLTSHIALEHVKADHCEVGNSDVHFKNVYVNLLVETAEKSKAVNFYSPL
ncbi:hypothetical protein [Streptococcus hyointestinalis]|uniref:hypothetical protein n=1 Tax=Streptococcus hyointestinalis TaxID=1337 RepID=UPI001F14F8DB|nr:hypothetical protein [Streptococcus hyointestinalis]